MKGWMFVLCIVVALAATYSYGQAAEGAISGRIQGSNGQPLVGARVTLLGIHYFYGKQYFYSAGFADTNEIGEYQILRVPPGRYYVRIDSSPENKPSGPSAYVSSTYFPGTNDLLHAKAVVLEQGQKARGIGFQAKPLPNGVIVSGTVVNRQTGGDLLPGGRLRRYVGMYLIPIQNGPAEPVYLKPAQAASNEETNFPFEIDGVPPGTYDFYASFSDNTSFGELDPSGITVRVGNNIKTRYFQARKRIEIAQTNITGLSVTIETGTEIHGRVSLHGEDKLQTSFRWMTSGPDEVRFLSMTRNQPLGDGSFPGKMEDDDRFTITGLLPGSYQLTSISSINDLELIDDAYLADLRQDGRSVSYRFYRLGGYKPKTTKPDRSFASENGHFYLLRTMRLGSADKERRMGGCQHDAGAPVATTVPARSSMNRGTIARALDRMGPALDSFSTIDSVVPRSVVEIFRDGILPGRIPLKLPLIRG